MIKKVPVLRDPGVPRRNNTQQILNAAEKTFSAYGLAGARVDDIAKACDLPKANILYYFGSKEDLYRATLQRLLSGWLEDADEWISTKYPPFVGLEGYIRAKMKFSRQRADASRLFMHELLAGGECIKDFLKTTLKNHVAEKKEVFEHWHKEGLFAEVDAAHFLFLLWSMTQAYADMQVQFSSVLGHRLQSADYENGVTMIMRMVGSFCQPSPESDAR